MSGPPTDPEKIRILEERTDELGRQMADFVRSIRPDMTLGELLQMTQDIYHWDMTQRDELDGRCPVDVLQDDDGMERIMTLFRSDLLGTDRPS